MEKQKQPIFKIAKFIRFSHSNRREDDDDDESENPPLSQFGSRRQQQINGRSYSAHFWHISAQAHHGSIQTEVTDNVTANGGGNDRLADIPVSRARERRRPPRGRPVDVRPAHSQAQA